MIPNLDFALVAILVVAVLFLRHQNRKEYSLLSDSLKEAIQTKLNRFRLAQFAAVVFALIAVILTGKESGYLEKPMALGAASAGLVALVAWTITALTMLRNRMGGMGFPANYTRTYIVDRLFPAILLGGLLGSVVWRLVQS